MPNIVAFAPMPSPSVAMTASGESRLEPKPAQRVAQVLREGAPPLGAPLAVDARAIDRRETLARPLHIAEPALGFACARRPVSFRWP